MAAVIIAMNAKSGKVAALMEGVGALTWSTKTPRTVSTTLPCERTLADPSSVPLMLGQICWRRKSTHCWQPALDGFRQIDGESGALVMFTAVACVA